MFKQITLQHVVEIPPELFGQPREDSAYRRLSQEFQGVIDPDLGFIIAICEIIEIGPGNIIHGNAGTFHLVKFSILTYIPVQSEVVEGEVVELVDFGAFIRLGPSDGLCHLSQITDDKMNYENLNAQFTGIESGKVLKVGDAVRARIISVSAGGARSGKLGLTMRQPYLGKIEWIEEEIDKKNKEALKGKSGTAKKSTKKKSTKKKSTKK